MYGSARRSRRSRRSHKRHQRGSGAALSTNKQTDHKASTWPPGGLESVFPSVKKGTVTTATKTASKINPSTGKFEFLKRGQGKPLWRTSRTSIGPKSNQLTAAITGHVSFPRTKAAPTAAAKGFCKSVYASRLKKGSYGKLSPWEKTRYKLCKHIFSRGPYKRDVMNQKHELAKKYPPIFAKRGGRRSRRSRRTRRSRRHSKKAAAWF